MKECGLGLSGNGGVTGFRILWDNGRWIENDVGPRINPFEIWATIMRPVSDHFPILLEGGDLRRGPSPFIFENMWLKVEGFKDLLKS